MAKIFWRRRVLTMKKKKIIDLSFDLEKDMITFPQQHRYHLNLQF